MLHLRDNFYKWLVEQDLSDDKCQQVQNLIDSICKEITKEELQLIHCIVEEKDIDIGYALSKYRFFANIKRKSHIIQNNEIIGITWKELVTELPLIIKGFVFVFVTQVAKLFTPKSIAITFFTSFSGINSLISLVQSNTTSNLISL